MLTYCFGCKKNTGNKNIEKATAKNGRTYYVSKCSDCGGKKSYMGDLSGEMTGKGYFAKGSGYW